MKPLGKIVFRKGSPNTPYGTGYTVFQGLEPSNMDIHCSDKKKVVEVLIYSCEKIDAVKVKNFTKKFFKSKKVLKFRKFRL